GHYENMITLSVDPSVPASEWDFGDDPCLDRVIFRLLTLLLAGGQVRRVGINGGGERDRLSIWRKDERIDADRAFGALGRFAARKRQPEYLRGVLDACAQEINGLGIRRPAGSAVGAFFAKGQSSRFTASRGDEPQISHHPVGRHDAFGHRERYPLPIR